MDASFNYKTVEKIDFKKDFGVGLFSSENQKPLFEVILEYDITNEFFLIDKIDAKFFHRMSSIKDKGQIIFSVSDLEWTSNLVFSLQDKVKVIAHFELKEAVKVRIKRINELYKDDI